MRECQAGGWFSTGPEYVGPGKAAFSDPSGTVTGRVSVTFNEEGNSSIVMDVSDLETTRRQSLLEFLVGTRSEKDGVASISFGGRTNPCTKLTVDTLAGTYVAEGLLHYSVSAGGSAERLLFSPGASEFLTLVTGTPHWWVLPLTNFISDFLDVPDNDLKEHPLRMYRGTVPDSGATRDALWRAERDAAFHDRLVTFTFNGSRAFVERLPDYHDREERLTAGRERALITAVMIGRVTGPVDVAAALDAWFPLHLPRFLGLATGTPVSTPWIEFRDERGTRSGDGISILESPPTARGMLRFEKAYIVVLGPSSMQPDAFVRLTMMALSQLRQAL